MHLFSPFWEFVFFFLFFSSLTRECSGMWIEVGGVGLKGDLAQVGLRTATHQQLVGGVC